MLLWSWPDGELGQFSLDEHPFCITQRNELLWIKCQSASEHFIGIIISSARALIKFNLASQDWPCGGNKDCLGEMQAGLRWWIRDNLRCSAWWITWWLRRIILGVHFPWFIRSTVTWTANLWLRWGKLITENGVCWGWSDGIELQF